MESTHQSNPTDDSHRLHYVGRGARRRTRAAFVASLCFAAGGTVWAFYIPLPAEPWLPAPSLSPPVTPKLPPRPAVGALPASPKVAAPLHQPASIHPGRGPAQKVIVAPPASPSGIAAHGPRKPGRRRVR